MSAALPPPAPLVLDANAVEAQLHRHESGVVPVLQNVVATVNLGAKLDLKEIAMHARNAEYNPKRFAAVIMRIREPKTTALIFASGKMVCTGAKSEEDSRAAARRYAKIVQKLGFPVTFTEFKIQNIVGSCDVKFPIRLEGLACSHSLFANYEPELFPGLIYRMRAPKIVLLIFVSGKVVLTGAKTRHEIYQAYLNIYSTLLQYRKGDAALPPANPMPPPPPPTRMLPAAPSNSQQAGAMLPPGAAGTSSQINHPQQQGGSMAPPGSSHMLPPPTPSHHNGLPPPTPSHHSLGLPPPTPSHHGGLPPPTPAHSGLLPQASYGMHLPPPTPHHDGMH